MGGTGINLWRDRWRGQTFKMGGDREEPLRGRVGTAEPLRRVGIGKNLWRDRWGRGQTCETGRDREKTFEGTSEDGDKCFWGRVEIWKNIWGLGWGITQLPSPNQQRQSFEATTTGWRQLPAVELFRVFLAHDVEPVRDGRVDADREVVVDDVARHRVGPLVRGRGRRVLTVAVRRRLL